MAERFDINPFTGKFDKVIDPLEATAHADLSDMPDSGGTNSDHDARYVKQDQTTPQVITATDTAITATDEVYFGDVTDSTKIKKDTVQGILDLVPAPDLTPYAKLDGTNQPFTDDIEVDGNGSASATVNATPDEVYGTGGDVVENITVGADIYRVHKFTTTGDATFVAPSPARNVEVLVVAGGGGGGNGGTGAGGGGGAGGYTYNAAYVTTAGQSISTTVGAGGGAATSGSNSVFGTITSVGGGKGGNYGVAGTAGGSGGGGGGTGGAAKAGGDADYLSPRQGYDGGTGQLYDATHAQGGGGGGASVAGSNYNVSNGKGGDGTANTITGASVTYAGGGGAGSESAGHAGAAGAGGGGAGGGIGVGSNGTANLGGGAGGGGLANGGSGGSGVVIVRYITTGSTTADPSYILKENSVEKWRIQSDGADSSKLKIKDAAGTEHLSIAQTTGLITATGAISATDATLTGLTSSQAVMTDADKKLVSADYLNQAVKTTSSPTFANITDSGLTASKVVFTDGSKVLTSTGIGTSDQFVKGDGSLDSSTYLTTAPENFSYETIVNGQTLSVPEYQQMCVFGELDIQETSELQLEGALVLEA